MQHSLIEICEVTLVDYVVFDSVDRLGHHIPHRERMFERSPTLISVVT